MLPLQKKMGIEQKDEKISPLPTCGSKGKNWTYQENQKYIVFLQENKESFEDEQTRRTSKIFLEMSLNI